MVPFGLGGPIKINLWHADGYGKPNRWLICYLRNGFEFNLPIYGMGKNQPAISTIVSGVDYILGRLTTAEEQAKIAKIQFIVP
jgi:hypothetical protein